MNYKEYHKELKKKVNIAEQVRNEDRSNKTWEDVRTLKKLKLQLPPPLSPLASPVASPIIKTIAAILKYIIFPILSSFLTLPVRNPHNKPNHSSVYRRHHYCRLHY